MTEIELLFDSILIMDLSTDWPTSTDCHFSLYSCPKTISFSSICQIALIGCMFLSNYNILYYFIERSVVDTVLIMACFLEYNIHFSRLLYVEKLKKNIDDISSHKLHVLK